MAAPTLWTFGHSTRSCDETVALLREAGVSRVIDVRTIRGSRHNPQFGAAEMQRWLPAAGIELIAIANLGGRRRSQGVDPLINAGWTHPSFHRYADWTLSEGFADGLAELTALADMTQPDGRPTAIMCAEAVPWRCHRSLIATVLVVRGWTVTHLLGPGQHTAHEVGRWGATPQTRPDGTVTYPPPTMPLDAADG